MFYMILINGGLALTKTFNVNAMFANFAIYSIELCHLYTQYKIPNG